jgi:hypothetical protein
MAGKARKHTVGVDSGTIIAIDPAYLFSDREWKQIIQCAYPSSGKKQKAKPSTFKACIRKAIKKRGGSAGGPRADFALISTGGDGGFEAGCKRGKFVINPGHCKLEE